MSGDEESGGGGGGGDGDGGVIRENVRPDVEPSDLYITVIESRTEFSNDLYVQIELEPWDVRTGVVNKSTTAVFNETFLVHGSQHRYAVINLMDRDTLSSDDVLGQCAVDLGLIGRVPKTCYLPMAPECTVYPLDPFDLPSTPDAFGSLSLIHI